MLGRLMAMSVLVGAGAISPVPSAQAQVDFKGKTVTVIDGFPRSSTARVKEAAQVSVIDQKKFRFMIDEVPNFAKYIMDAMAHRIRGMGRNIA